nr:extracellular calcium-sensing receptor-like isoform X3 [Danio rerio]|eukprot:XP_009291999.1 extracellular calcium-sensing receptor-like isoform X3 [Danio rerio]
MHSLETMTILLLWLLVYHLSVLNPAQASKCLLQNEFEPGLMANGDFVIGGIFPLHYNQEMPDLNFTYKPGPVKCNGFDTRAFRWAITMKLAVEEINKRVDLLPNYTLGYKIFDSCAYPLTGQRSAVAVLNGPNELESPLCADAAPLLAVIGESGSAQSIVVSRILQPFGIPMISYFSSCACLSDRREFPTFFRVIPSDAYQVKAIAKLLRHFNWTWIGVIRGDHEYGRFALQGLLKELEGTGICVAYQKMIPLLYDRQKALEIIHVMSHSTARVVVVFSAEGELTPFLRDYMEQNVTGIQWIASEAWVTSSVFAGSEFDPFLGGTIGFGIRQGQIPRLKEYLTTVNPERYPTNPLVYELWGALYGCSPSWSNLSSHLPSCTGKETVRLQYSAYLNTSSPRISYNVYKAAYAIAYSLHNLIYCTPGKGPFSNSTCANAPHIYPWQLQQYLQEVSFTISGEKVNFDMKGDSIPSYDLINWQRGSAGNIEFINVGMFDGALESGQELVIKEEAIMWPGHQTEASCSHSVLQYMRSHVLKFCRVNWRCWCLCAATAVLRDSGRLFVVASLCAALTVYHVTVAKSVMRQIH